MFAARGIPGFNADEEVHRLQAPDGAAIPALAAAFPGTVEEGVLNRARLRALVLADPAQMRRLEGIMHPLVRAAQARFLAGGRGKGQTRRAAGHPSAVRGRPPGGFRQNHHCLLPARGAD